MSSAKKSFGSQKIGLIGASAIVSGNMMSSGIALLPSALAAIGSITCISWIVTLIGALALAFVFARLGILDPREGGLVTYSKELSSIFGFQAGLLYWLANWVGNLAIGITAIEYLSFFYKPLAEPLLQGTLLIGLIWVFTLINFLGPRKIANIVSISVIFLLIPVVSTALFGWFYFSKDFFLANWNVSGSGGAHAVFLGIVLTIWSFIGVESASVNAGIVENPKKNIPLATMIGTGLAGIVYLLSCTVISGMFPAAVLSKSGSPFGDSFSMLVGSWGESVVAISTAIACLASLGSWMMLVGQAGAAAAKQGTLPEVFGEKNAKGIPVKGLTLTSILMTIVMAFLMANDYISKKSSIEMFGQIISIAVLTTVIPYFYSCLHFIKIDPKSTHFLLRLLFCLVAVCFCFLAFIGAPQAELASLIILFFLCYTIYFLKLKIKGMQYENYLDDTTWRS